MSALIAVLAGDGIGPEVTAAAQEVLRAVVPGVEFVAALAGGAAVDATGDPLPAETVAACRNADAILLGAVGGPRYDALPPEQRPERGLLRLRREFGLYANLRPTRVWPGLAERSPLRASLAEAVDLVIVRELTGGLYYGEKRLTDVDGDTTATETLIYRASEIERVAHVAFALARERRGRVTSVDKANVLVSSRLWRDVVTRVAAGYPDVTLEHVLVDTAAMKLVAAPGAFDVIVTENLFGDILSDEAAALTGSIGTAPSASLGAGEGRRRFGLYEPVAGSAPDIAGRGIANPAGAILSAAMLARWSLGDAAAADRIESAVAAVLRSGPQTPDLGGEDGLTTAAVTAAIVERCAPVRA